MSNSQDWEGVQVYESLLASGGLAHVSNEEALKMLAKLIDLSSRADRAAGTTRALEWCEQLQNRELSSSQRALLSYFCSNAWANRQHYKHRDGTTAWTWEQPEIQQQILLLRSAVTRPGFEELHPTRRCQILTNLANLLNTVGRFVEALEHWDRALGINPHFGMALGNRGYALERYGRALYNKADKAVFLREAHEALATALSPEANYEATYDDAKAFFAKEKDRIETVVEVQKVPRFIDLHPHELGSTDQEIRYRRWCLSNRLFLNPLNDLGQHESAARDVLLLPSFITLFEDPPTLIGFFNQMKQEFVSARWLFYEGANSTDVHFSDRNVSLYNTLDYPSYSLSVEKIKVAYRMAYSIFDKFGFFLNKYFELGVKPTGVYFRTIWYTRTDQGERSLRPEFAGSQNWPLRGLFWLSKDFFDPELSATTEPDAQGLYEIRNHIEHKYFKVHDMLPPRPGKPKPGSPATADPLAYSIQRAELQAKTLRLLKLARAAFIYLLLGMHSAERRRHSDKESAHTVSLALWKDEWKI